MNFDTRGLKIMVVENDRTVLEIIQLRLEVAGFHSAMARTGRSAIEALANFRPAALVIEMNLPDMSGLDVLEALNSSVDRCAVPTLIMAKQLGQGDLKLAISLGARDCIAKPFSGADILTRVSRLLGKSAPIQGRSVVHV